MKRLKKMLAVMITLMMICGAMPTQVYAAIPLDTPTNLRWNGTEAEWDAVEYADKYRVDIYKNESKVQSFDTEDTSYDMLSWMLTYDIGTYTFKVQALQNPNDGNHSESPYSEISTDSYEFSFPYLILDIPTNLRIDGTVAKWDFTPGTIANFDIDIYKDAILLASVSLTETECDLLSFMQSGGNGTYTFRVKAVPTPHDIYHSESQYSEMSTDSYEFRDAADPLAAPTNLRWNEAVAEWDAVAYADGYIIEIYKDSTIVDGNIIESTSYDLISTVQTYGNGTYTFRVKAFPADYDTSHKESQYSEMSTDSYEFSAAPLDTPTNLRFANFYAEWDAVAYAAEYTVEIYKDSTNVYVASSVEGISINLIPVMQTFGNGTYTFKVQAVPASSDKSHIESPYSTMSTDSCVYSGTPLAAPINLRLNGTVAEWDAVAYAAKYVVEIYKDSTLEYSTNIEETSFNILFTMQEYGNGTYTFKVQAVPADDDKSHMVGPYSVMSTDSYMYSATPLDTPTNLRFRNLNAEWDAVTDAFKYQIKWYKEGNYIFTTDAMNLQYSLVGLAVNYGKGNYSFSVMAVADPDDMSRSNSPYSAISTVYKLSCGGGGSSAGSSGSSSSGGSGGSSSVKSPSVVSGYFSEIYSEITTSEHSVYSGTWEAHSDGAWYLMTESGTPATNRWALMSDKWYVLNSTGKMVTGWAKVDRKWYHMGADGAMAVGWLLDAGKWYYLGADGAMLNGWIMDAEKWYYLGTDGAMLVSTTTPDGYQVGADGVWIQ